MSVGGRDVWHFRGWVVVVEQGFLLTCLLPQDLAALEREGNRETYGWGRWGMGR